MNWQDQAEHSDGTLGPVTMCVRRDADSHDWPYGVAWAGLAHIGHAVDMASAKDAAMKIARAWVSDEIGSLARALAASYEDERPTFVRPANRAISPNRRHRTNTTLFLGGFKPMGWPRHQSGIEARRGLTSG